MATTGPPFPIAGDFVTLNDIQQMGIVLRLFFARVILAAGMLFVPVGVMAAQDVASPATSSKTGTSQTGQGPFSSDAPVTVPAPGGHVMQHGFTSTRTAPAIALPGMLPDNPLAAIQDETPPAKLDASHVLVQMAGQWASFEKDLWNWGRRTATSDMDLEQTMLTLGSYDSEQLSRGWMATNALIAIQIKPFADGVMQWESDYGRDFMLQSLHKNLNYVTMIPGAKAARDAVLRASHSDAEQLATMGYLYKDQAYSMQKHAWASKVLHGKAMKLQAFRLAPRQSHPVSLDELNRLAAPGRRSLEAPFDPASARTEFLSALKLGPRSAFAGEQDTMPPAPALTLGREATISQALGLAALMILGADSNNPDFLKWSQEPNLEQCVSLSRINMAQCLAAGHFVYETSFCIAQHQIIDMGQCLGKVSAPPSTTGVN